MLDFASDPAAAFALLVPNVAFFSGVFVGYVIQNPEILEAEDRRPIWEVVEAPEFGFGLLFTNSCLGLASYIVSDYDYSYTYVNYGLMLIMFAALNPLSQSTQPKFALVDVGLTAFLSLTTSLMFWRLHRTAFYLSLPHLIFISAAFYGSFRVYQTSIAFKD